MPSDHHQAYAFTTDLGWMAILGRGSVLRRVTFNYGTAFEALSAIQKAGESLDTVANWNPKLVKRLRAYVQGSYQDFCDVIVDTGRFTPFQAAVTEALRAIQYGETISYGELAAHVGSPGSARAVGNVMAANPCPLIVPCHRVIAAGGKIGRFSAPGGIETKRRLLRLEGVCLDPQPHLTGLQEA